MSDLAEQLARAAGDASGPLDVADLHRRANRRRRRARTVRAVGIVAAALVVAATVTVLSQRSTSTDVVGPARTDNGVGEPGKWVQIAKAPIAPRRNAVTVWTGSEVLLFGGFATPASKACPKTTDDWPLCAGTPTASLRTGAAYDPKRDSWRRIAPLPVGTAAYQPINRSRSHATATRTDNTGLRRLNAQVLDGRVYVLADSETHPTGPALLVYDIDADRWSIVTTLKGTGVETWALTSWGGKLVVYVADGRTRLARDRIFDPATRQWSDASEPPDGDAAMIGIPPSMSRQMIGFGSKLYVFATTDQVPPGEDRVAAGTTLEVATFDGTHWALVQHTMAPASNNGIWAATGDRFTYVVPTQLTFPPNASHPPWGPSIVTFDPVTHKFEEPDPRNTPDAHLVESDAPVLGNGTSAAVVTSTASLIRDTSGTWTVAKGPAAAAIDDFATASAGDQLLIWGGTSPKDVNHAAAFNDRGWIWTPSTSNSVDPTSTSQPGPATTVASAAVSAAQLAHGTWHDLPIPPVTIGGDAGVVWTGTRLFAWGGSDNAAPTPDSDISRSGALYDPAAQLWRTTAPAPIAPRSRPTTVWTGSEVLVWGGLDASRHVVNDGAAYNPTTNAWHKLPSTNAPGTGTQQPGVRPTLQAAVWTGTKLAVFTPVSPAATDSSTIAQSFYDPTTDTWVERAPKHDARAENRLATIDAVASGGHTLVWLSWSSTMKQRPDGSSTEDLPPEQSLFEVDTTPDTGSIGWTRVSVPAATPIITDPIDAGGVVAATTNPYSLDAFYRGPAPSGIPTVVLSLTEGRTGPAATWTQMPQGRLNTTNQPQVWTGDALIRFNVEIQPSPTSQQQPGDLDALDWNSHVWTTLPRSPWEADSETLRLIRTGDALIVWGQLKTTCADQPDDCTPFQGRSILGTELVPAGAG